ncbi:DNA mismatch repair endonuclease MutL [Halococcus salifodinae]|uniref:DNA mismatch repair protein MutL n=1 Tax=Halococcus salifodinae DSM 8989 TaxID=1227456 RepID=M0NCF6_9EURY|nr:DNA mismatch repair endonuclease MutL [Halococcus salifodinae]EMA54360.1 DNA mismatch repair protein MutL [Halococcus salifodinae DSM 8989]
MADSDTNIQQLDPTTVERIAAGEVVERPASVVKELVENSIDADASRIRVVAEEGGTEYIRIVDDGIGMSQTDVEAAVEKHTTSKISDIEDLETGLATLGFRGEALAAIGEVSRLTIRTKPRGGSRGTELHLEGGTVESVEPAGCPEGTAVEINDLFYNVPARRKYLSAESTEFSHINDVATGYALANPDVAVALEHNDRETFATTGQDDLEATTLAVYGREVAEAMLPIPDDAVPDGPLNDLHGIISHPETTRSSPDYLRTYVNGRFVSAKTVRDAVVDAYDKQLGPGRYPFAVLYCELSGAEIDVNVHPRKREIRFAEEQAVRGQVEQAIQAALLDHGLLRSSAPRGESAPEQATIDPGQSGLPSESTDTASPSPSPADPSAGADTDTDATPESQEGSPTTEITTETATPETTETPAGESGHEADVNTRPASETGAENESGGQHQQPTPNTTSDQSTSPSDTEAAEHNTPDADESSPTGTARFTAPAEQATLDGETAADVLDPDLDNLPSLRVLGQFRETYLVAESPDGLVLIDQHAADERVNYERLREQFDGETPAQALASPVELDLTAGEAALFEVEECAAALDHLGFDAERVDDTSVEVTSVPGIVTETAAPDLLRDALAAFAAGDRAADTIDDAIDELVADLACYPSITGNTSLTEGSVVDLLDTLDQCENPYACPHGRPVIIELPDTDIEARFERDYPGHPSPQGR